MAVIAALQLAVPASVPTYPSSVSLMMSQISMLRAQSSLCREPSVAFSEKKPQVTKMTNSTSGVGVCGGERWRRGTTDALWAPELGQALCSLRCPILSLSSY